MDAGLVEGLGVHLGEKPPCAWARVALMGQPFHTGPSIQDPEASPAPGTSLATQGSGGLTAAAQRRLAAFGCAALSSCPSEPQGLRLSDSNPRPAALPLPRPGLRATWLLGAICPFSRPGTDGRCGSSQGSQVSANMSKGHRGRSCSWRTGASR